MIEIHERYQGDRTVPITFQDVEGNRHAGSVESELKRPVVYVVICAVCGFETKPYKNMPDARKAVLARMARHNPCQEDCV